MEVGIVIGGATLVVVFPMLLVHELVVKPGVEVDTQGADDVIQSPGRSTRREVLCQLVAKTGLCRIA